jgi:hypothetical protein
MAGTKKAEVAQQIIKETTSQADQINAIQYGEVTYVIQSGKLQRIKLDKIVITK